MIIANTFLRKALFVKELPFSYGSTGARKPLSACREAQIAYKFL